MSATKAIQKKGRKKKTIDYHREKSVQVRLIPQVVSLLDELVSDDSRQSNRTAIISLAIKVLHRFADKNPDIIKAAELYEKDTKPCFTRGHRKPRQEFAENN